jgi:CheY-like chemotaxis protein
MNNEIDSTETTAAKRGLWMVVDDDAGVLEFLARLLKSLNLADVRCFRTAVHALRAFEAQPDHYRFVVTDLVMPGMDGIEFCRRLRSISPRLKILLSTGSGLITDEEARRIGFCGLLPKPFPVATLCRAVGAVDDTQNTFNAAPIAA